MREAMSFLRRADRLRKTKSWNTTMETRWHPGEAVEKCTTRRENYQSEGEEEPPLTLEILRAEQKQCAEEGHF